MLVDGHLAGASFHFPVIYSGGNNPLFWRPMAGIMQFDVPPHRFDLSPLIGYFADGSAHTVEVAVFHDGAAGVWHLAAALLEYTDPAAAAGAVALAAATASAVRFEDSGAAVAVAVSHPPAPAGSVNVAFDTSGSHSFAVTRTATLADGSTVTVATRGDLRMENHNAVERRGEEGESVCVCCVRLRRSLAGVSADARRS